jgi:hypothetical protein
MPEHMRSHSDFAAARTPLRYIDTRKASGGTPSQLCTEILAHISARYDGTDHGREWARLYLWFKAWHDGLEERNLNMTLVNHLDVHIVSMCETLEEIYALFPGVVVRDEEHEQLIAILKAAGRHQHKDAACIAPSQTVGTCLCAMLDTLSEHLSADMSDLVRSQRKGEKNLWLRAVHAIARLIVRPCNGQPEGLHCEYQSPR